MLGTTTQPSKAIAQERCFCNRQTKGDRSSIPVFRPNGKRHERRIEAEKRLTIVIRGCALILQQPMCISSRDGPPIQARADYPPNRERIPIDRRWRLAGRSWEDAAPDYLRLTCIFQSTSK